MSNIPAEVFNAANPFSNFDRLGGWDDYEDDDAPPSYQQHQQHSGGTGGVHPNPRNNSNNNLPQTLPNISADKAAQVAAALQLTNQDEREDALRRLYGDEYGPGAISGGRSRSSQGRSASEGGGGEEGSLSPMRLPGGASSLEELLSRAAALDRECFDLQNECVRWERESTEAQGDIMRVSGSLNRYASELNQVESSVAELNQWFQDHQCANDPERYERVGELNRDVCGLRMRISSLEGQLETLLHGTLESANFGTPNRDSPTRHHHSQQQNQQHPDPEDQSTAPPAPRGGRSGSEAQRMADIVSMVSPQHHHGTSRNQNNNNPNSPNSRSGSGSHLVPIASPTRIPLESSVNAVKTYISELERKTLEQDVLILRLEEAAAKRERLLHQERDNDIELQALRQKLDTAGITIPVAPIQHRTSRAMRKNQASSTAAALTASPGGGDIAKRTIRLPSGVLRDLTRELQASVRQVAHRCGVGEIAVEIASDATLLHCRGILRAVNAFEDEVTAAAERCQRHRALGGVVTYAIPQVAAVVADSADKIARLLYPDN